MFKLSSIKKKQSKYYKPPIPLLKPEERALKTGKYHTYKVRTNPTVAKSPTYELVVLYCTGTCKEYLQFCNNFNKACIGQNTTQGPGKFMLVRHLLEGEALTEFKLQVQEVSMEDVPMSETNKTVMQCLDAVQKSVFPACALLLQKHYMRRNIHKLCEVKTRKLLVRIYEMNNHLSCFPGENATKLGDSEMKEIAKDGIPNEWQTQMSLQNFNATEKIVPKFIDLYEWLELLKENGENDNQRKSHTMG